MKNSLINLQNRRNQILKIISENGEISVDALSHIFSVTTVTIRKDLDLLEKDGKIERTFGGAKILENHILHDLEDDIRIQKKRALAKLAASLLYTDDIVLLNSSITASYVVEYFNNKPITVITNNTSILNRNMDPQTILLMTGGQVLPGRKSLSGSYTIETINKTFATSCILGVCGISIKGGITSPVLEESTINRTMISKTAGRVIVIASSDRIGRDDSFYISDISKVNILITDSGITESDRKAFEEIGIKVLISTT